MKIAILTQPLRANYGGVLQNYAMQQVLMRLGHSPITLEKDPYEYISTFRLTCDIPKRVITKYILRKRDHIYTEKIHNQFVDSQPKTLQPFIKSYINHKYVLDYDFIDQSNYNAFIVGSDQVWRPLYNWNVLDKMFLSFIPESINIKRIAYAASFGTSEWEYDEAQTKKCSELINKFDAVSTREIDGVDLCKKYLKRDDVVSVLDPTLLLNQEDYLTLCKDIPTNEEKLLFAYILDTDTETLSKLKDIANANGLKLKLVSAHDNCTLSMEEWLAMFRDAKMVITDSFHGTVFSIIFNKEFFTITNLSRGGSRFTSLLSQLSLSDRMFNSIFDVKFNDNIDWSIVNNKLSLLKDKSLNFLMSALNNK